MMRKRGPAIHVETDGGAGIQVVLIHEDGTETRLPKRTPAEDLLIAMDRDYSSYRRKITTLEDDHSLFEGDFDVSVPAYAKFVAEARHLTAELEKLDPAAFFVMGARLDAALRIPDDGSAMFLLQSKGRILKILEEPITAQIRLRNIFELAFDDHERGTQRERFEAVESAYPGLLDRFLQVRRLPETEGDVPFGPRLAYSPIGLYELYVIELILYFQQERQRIVRCENCWRYFIPKTKKETLYCDRVTNGVSCKKAGPNWKRKVGPEYDEALKIYDQLRARMSERLARYMNAAEWRRGDLFPMSIAEYDDWITLAHSTRIDYLSGKLTAEEFLKKIDIYSELESYTAERKDTVSPDATDWRFRIRHDLNFDPLKDFEPMMVLDLREGDSGAAWQYFERDDLAKLSRGGQESLHKKYGNKGGQPL